MEVYTQLGLSHLMPLQELRPSARLTKPLSELYMH